jgi:hypothetical protein
MDESRDKPVEFDPGQMVSGAESHPAQMAGEIYANRVPSEIWAFDLTTQALKCIDDYQRGNNDSLREARTLLRDALSHDPKYFRAQYLLAIVRYLDHVRGAKSKENIPGLLGRIDELGKEFAENTVYREFEDLPIARDWRIQAEVYYNFATVEYEVMPLHDKKDKESYKRRIDSPTDYLNDISERAIRHFALAQSDQADHDLRVASTIGELAARLKRYDEDDLSPIEALKAKLDAELPDNFFLRIIRRNRASPKLIRWARQMKRKLAYEEYQLRSRTSEKVASIEA